MFGKGTFFSINKRKKHRSDSDFFFYQQIHYAPEHLLDLVFFRLVSLRFICSKLSFFLGNDVLLFQFQKHYFFAIGSFFIRNKVNADAQA